MNRKVPYDKSLILTVLTIVAFGLVMVFSSSSLISKQLYGSSTEIFVRQLISVSIGLLLLFFAMRTDYHLLGRPVIVASIILGSVSLLIWALQSPEINGVTRWIQIASIRFQPSEAAKLAVVILTAFFLKTQGGVIRDINRAMVLYGGVLVALVVLVLLEPDFGTSTSLAVTAALLLFIGGLRYRYYLSAFILAIPAFYFLIYRVPYRRERILAFLDPGADPYGSGYQILQSLVAVGSGGMTGKGLAQGTQKLFFLPEPHSDFIYAVVGEEMGFLGCAALLGLFAILLWRGIRISIRADSIFGTYLGLGIVSMIVFQAFFNMSVVLSLCPTKGIPLPFVSVGGSSSLVMLAAVGILLNISRQSRGQLTLPTRPAEGRAGEEIGDGY